MFNIDSNRSRAPHNYTRPIHILELNHLYLLAIYTKAPHAHTHNLFVYLYAISSQIACVHNSNICCCMIYKARTYFTIFSRLILGRGERAWPRYNRQHEAYPVQSSIIIISARHRVVMGARRASVLAFPHTYLSIYCYLILYICMYTCVYVYAHCSYMIYVYREMRKLARSPDMAINSYSKIAIYWKALLCLHNMWVGGLGAAKSKLCITYIASDTYVYISNNTFIYL